MARPVGLDSVYKAQDFSPSITPNLQLEDAFINSRFEKYFHRDENLIMLVNNFEMTIFQITKTAILLLKVIGNKNNEIH